jgi:hypothetical protein
MRPDPNDDTATLIHRLEGVAQILSTLGMDMHQTPPATLLLLADVTDGIANGLMDRLQTD